MATTEKQIIVAQVYWNDAQAEYIALTPGYTNFDKHFVEPTDESRTHYECVIHSDICTKYVFKDRW